MATGYQIANLPLNLMKGDITDLSAIGTTVKCCLMTSSATPDQETWDSYADVVADTNEVAAAGGYATGGEAVGTKTVTEAAKVTTFDGDDVTWTPNVTITAQYAVLYDDTPVANADKKLLGYWDFGADYGVINGSLTLGWNASGVLTVTVA
jgi:hypothetical protein